MGITMTLGIAWGGGTSAAELGDFLAVPHSVPPGEHLVRPLGRALVHVLLTADCGVLLLTDAPPQLRPRSLLRRLAPPPLLLRDVAIPTTLLAA